MDEAELESKVIYAAMRTELVELERGLPAVDRSTLVPNSPAWTVRDVLAHVIGVNSDVVNGNVEQLGADEWTRNQVESRAGMSVADLCDEWEGMAEETTAFMSADPFMGVRIGADLVTHIHDVLEALGRSDDDLAMSCRAGAGVRSALSRYGPFFCERVAGASLPTVRVTVTPDEIGDQSWKSEAGAEVAELSGSAFELVRAFTGRLSVEQVLAMDWTGDPEPYLDVINPYGALKFDR